MTSKQKTILAFDVYGTVLSTESIARKLATFVGEEKSKAIAKSWRKYQLEYTWRCNSMGKFDLSSPPRPSQEIKSHDGLPPSSQLAECTTDDMTLDMQASSSTS